MFEARQRLKRFAWTFLPTLLVSCHSASPERTQSVTRVPLAVYTQLQARRSRLEAQALHVPVGQNVHVRCVVRRGAQLVDSLPWQAVAEPPMQVVKTSSVEVVLRAATPGSHRVRCIAGNGERGAEDAEGQQLVVLAPDPDSEPTPPMEAEETPRGDRPGTPFVPQPMDPVPPEADAHLPYAWNAEWPDADQDNCYWQGHNSLLLHKKVYDATGAVVPNARIVITSDPDAEIDPELHAVRFPHAGTYRVRAEVVGPYAPGATLQPVERVFVVDSTPPRIEVATPARGAMLQAAGHAHDRVRVQGVIEDERGLLSASINGQALALEPNTRSHAFDMELPATWGLNTLQISATDRCDRSSHHAQTFVHSPTYAASTSEPTPAVRARLAQPALDDGSRDAPVHVASLVEHALQTDALKDMLPEHLTAYPDQDGDGRLDEATHHCWSGPWTQKKTGFEVVRNGPFSYGRAEVLALEAHPGYWSARVAFHDLQLPVRADQYQHLHCVASPRIAHVEATVVARTLTVAFNIEVNPHEAQLQVPKDSLQVRFEPGEPRLNFAGNGRAAAPLSLLEQVRNGAFARAYDYLFAETLRGRLHEELQGGLASFVGSMRLDGTLLLPAPLRGEVRYATAVDHLEVGGEGEGGYGELGFAAAMESPQTPPSRWGLPQLPPGPIRHASTVADLTMAPGQTASLAVYDDFINQSLHALWLQDAFSIANLGEHLRASQSHLASDGMDASFFATLPPVVMPGDGPNRVRLGWGDAYVTANVDVGAFTDGRASGTPMRVTAFVSAQMDATLSIDAQNQHLTLTSVAPPSIAIQVIDLPEVGHQDLASTQLEYWMSAAMPALAQTALGGVPLPIFNTEGEPAVWRLDSAEVLRPAGGTYSVLRGRLVAAPLQNRRN